MSDDYDDLLRKQDWRALSRRTTVYAFAALRKTSFHLAQELAQEVIAGAFDPKVPRWDPAVHPDIADFLMWRVRHLIEKRRRKKSTHAELAYDHAALEEIGQTPDDATPGLDGDAPSKEQHPRASRGSPEDLLIAGERARLRAEQVRVAFADDPVATRVIHALQDHVDGRAAQAALLGTERSIIRNARDRIAQKLAALDREERELRRRESAREREREREEEDRRG